MSTPPAKNISSHLSKVDAFRLVAVECLRDGEADDWERRRLAALADVLALGQEEVREALLAARSFLREPGTSAATGADPAAIYESVLSAALADRVLSAEEGRILLGLRRALHIDDAHHHAALQALAPTGTQAAVSGDDGDRESVADVAPVSSEGSVPRVSSLLERSRAVRTRISAASLQEELGRRAAGELERTLRRDCLELCRSAQGPAFLGTRTAELDEVLENASAGLALAGEEAGIVLPLLATAAARGASFAFLGRARHAGPTVGRPFEAGSALAPEEVLTYARVLRARAQQDEGAFAEAQAQLQEARGSVSSPELRAQLGREQAAATPPREVLRYAGLPAARGWTGLGLATLAALGAGFAIGLAPLAHAAVTLLPLAGMAATSKIVLGLQGIEFKNPLESRLIRWEQIATLTGVWAVPTRGVDDYDYDPTPQMCRVDVEFDDSRGSRQTASVASGWTSCRRVYDLLEEFLRPILLRRDLRRLERDGALQLGPYTLGPRGMRIAPGQRELPTSIRWANVGSVGTGSTSVVLHLREPRDGTIELPTWNVPNLFTFHHVLREACREGQGGFC